MVGVAASVFANMLHANMRNAAGAGSASPVALGLAGWAPLAFFAVVEILSRMPAGRSLASLVRYFAAAVVGCVAAWISYWHMVKVAAHYGESSPHLLPLSVDGLIVVASMCLVELTRSAGKRARETAVTSQPATAAEKPPVTAPTPPAPALAEPTKTPTPVAATAPPRKRSARQSERKPDVDRGDIARRVLAGDLTYEQAMAEGRVKSRRAVEMWVASYREGNLGTAERPVSTLALVPINGYDRAAEGVTS